MYNGNPYSCSRTEPAIERVQ